MNPSKALLSGFLIAAGVSASAGSDLIDWFKGNISSKIQLTGHQTFTYRAQSVSGDKQAYFDQWYRGRGEKPLYDERYVTVRGKDVLGVLNFEVQMDNSPYANPMDRRVSLNYARGPVKVDLGDINATLLNTNDLVRFSRTMQGGQAEFRWGPLTVKSMYSQTKSAARTVSITGNNSQGPYYLQAGLIVDGSLRVQVDGVEQKMGEDFNVNIYGGTITFIDKVIPPTSTILLTYETQGLNQSRGDVYGGGLAYDVAPGLSIGLTHIEQKPKANVGLQNTTEEFQGFGQPNTPYFLLYVPQPGQLIRVLVGGILQIEGIDYYFDLNNPQVFYFTRFMPPDPIIRVSYTPKPDPGTFGNGKRMVDGADLNWKIGKSGRLNLSLAKSTLQTPLGNEEGLAKSLNFSYTWGRLGIQTRLRDVPSEYVTIESTGFNRNDRGLDTKLNYRAGKGFVFGLNLARSEIGTPTFTNGGLETISGRSKQFSLSGSYTPVKDKNLWMNLAQTQNSYNGLGNKTMAFNSGYREKREKWLLDLSAGAHEIDSKKIVGNQTQDVATSLYGVRSALTYKFSEKFDATGGIGFNNIVSDGEKSSGTDLFSRLTWRPNDKLIMDFAYADTNSGAIAGISGYQGSAVGYGGSGFSSGSSSLLFNHSASRSRVVSIHAGWIPIANLSLDFNVAKSFAKGDNQNNSDMTSAMVGASWTPGSSTRVTVTMQQANVQFVNQPGSSDTTLFSLGWDQDFGKRWRWNTDYQSSTFGGSGVSSFSRTVNSLSSNLSYEIGPRQRAFLEYRRGNVVGYLADIETNFGLGYAYELIPGIFLRGTYRIRTRDGLDALTSSTGYRSNGFDFQLEFGFGR